MDYYLADFQCPYCGREHIIAVSPEVPQGSHPNGWPCAWDCFTTFRTILEYGVWQTRVWKRYGSEAEMLVDCGWADAGGRNTPRKWSV